jgi:hypothetical protein
VKQNVSDNVSENVSENVSKGAPEIDAMPQASGTSLMFSDLPAFTRYIEAVLGVSTR